VRLEPPAARNSSTNPAIALAFGKRRRQIARHDNRARDLHYGFDYYPLTFVGGAVFLHLHPKCPKNPPSARDQR